MTTYAPAWHELEAPGTSFEEPPCDVVPDAHTPPARDEPSWCLDDAARLTGLSVVALRKLAGDQHLRSWKEAGSWRIAHSVVVLMRLARNPQLSPSPVPFEVDPLESSQTSFSIMFAVGVGLSPRSAAAVCGLEPRQLKRLASSGRLRAFHTPGGHIRYHEDDIQALASSQVIPHAS